MGFCGAHNDLADVVSVRVGQCVSAVCRVSNNLDSGGAPNDGRSGGSGVEVVTALVRRVACHRTSSPRVVTAEPNSGNIKRVFGSTGVVIGVVRVGYLCSPVPRFPWRETLNRTSCCFERNLADREVFFPAPSCSSAAVRDRRPSGTCRPCPKQGIIDDGEPEIRATTGAGKNGNGT